MRLDVRIDRLLEEIAPHFKTRSDFFVRPE